MEAISISSTPPSFQIMGTFRPDEKKEKERNKEKEKKLEGKETRGKEKGIKHNPT